MNYHNERIRTKVGKDVFHHLSVGRRFMEKPDDYLFRYTTTVNGKEREIVTYKSNTDGAALRHFHKSIDTFFRYFYDSSDASTAYKIGTSIHSCLERHLCNDVFLKADIHNYFGSIDKEKLKERIARIHPVIYRRDSVSEWVDCCFYENHLPIGLIPSPVLSDIYLLEVDRYFERMEGIVYTRYADDFIISATGEDAETRLKSVLDELTKMLNESSLDLNRRKTYIRRLKQPGDAIHLLGLNIVSSESGKNRITVSDSYIRKTSIEYCEYLNTKNNMSEEEQKKAFSEVNGKIQFILHSSGSSAAKLQKMLTVKLNRPIPEEIIEK